MFGFNKYLLACYTILFLNVINFGYETLIIIGVLILIAKMKETIAPIIDNFITDYVTNIAINFINTLNNKLNVFLRTTNFVSKKLVNYDNDYYMINQKIVSMKNLFYIIAKKQFKKQVSITKNNLNETCF